MVKQELEYQLQTIIGKCPSKSKNLDVIHESYLRLKNVWKVGAELGLKGQYIHSVLSREGLINKMNYFTKEDEVFLIDNYLLFKRDSSIVDLAKIMNRTPQFISRKAKKLGLTNTAKHIISNKLRDKQGKIQRQWLKNNPHPKGMLGKKHTTETLKKFKDRVSPFENPFSIVNTIEYRQNISNRQSKLMKERLEKKPQTQYSRVKNGHIVIAGRKLFVRSSWEANICAYLQFLKDNKEILEWEYEVETFWFDKIKRGVRSYKPDFKITDKDSSVYFIEVKGWMDDKSKTKLKRMKKYHPLVRIDLLDQKRYTAIKKQSGLIKEWGQLDNIDKTQPRIEFILTEVNN